MISLLQLLTGCGGVGDVSGRVTHEGKPVLLGTVTFFSGQAGPQVGVIQPDGTFEVNEIPTGVAQISVYSRDPRPKPGRRPMPKGPPDENGERSPHPAYTKAQVDGWFPIPGKYFDPRGSGLTFDVKKGENNYDIELK